MLLLFTHNNNTQDKRLFFFGFFGEKKCLMIDEIKKVHHHFKKTTRQKSNTKTTEKKEQKKEEEEEEERDVFDVLPERGREARVHAQGARRRLPRAFSFSFSFFLRGGEVRGGVLLISGALLLCVLERKKKILAAFCRLSNSFNSLSLTIFFCECRRRMRAENRAGWETNPERAPGSIQPGR